MNEPARFRQAQQRRSRNAQEKIFEVSANLLKEKGPDEFTLKELSKLTGVSVGSIYYRFESKETLLIELQKKEYLQATKDIEARFVKLAETTSSLKEAIKQAGHEYAEHLQIYAPLIRAFMKLALNDKIVSEAGTKIYKNSQALYESLLLKFKDEIKRENPERVAHTCFKILNTSLARYLGFGSLEPITEGLSWEELLEEVTEVQTYYLCSPDHNA